jgi:1-acyl-sn-glycerol-3-phosphate acyltransferase
MSHVPIVEILTLLLTVFDPYDLYDPYDSYDRYDRFNLFSRVFFPLLKLYAKLALKIYCRSVLINKAEYLRIKGPVLFAANHPNSFLDGVILTTLSKENIYSLARGDVFSKPFFKKLLYRLHLRPVYRTSEGTENLAHNYTTFAACHEVFKKNGIVIIFSEGGCVNEWHLRPLKKGTARLAISSWKQDIPLTVIPVGFNYSGFRNFGKNLHINFGEPIDPQTILSQDSEGKQLLAFNSRLEQQLEELVYEIPLNNTRAVKQKLNYHVPAWQKILLLPFALAGLVVHAPLYLLVKAVTCRYFDNDHFDSVVISVLMLTYPIYYLLLLMISCWVFGTIATICSAFLLPFAAWAYVRIKPQFNKHFRANAE